VNSNPSGPIKAVIIHFDEETERLCISSIGDLRLPKHALGVVSVDLDDLQEMGRQEVDRRISGTVLGVLEVFHQRKIVGEQGTG
jgi:hypothetical protein